MALNNARGGFVLGIHCNLCRDEKNGSEWNGPKLLTVAYEVQYGWLIGRDDFYVVDFLFSRSPTYASTQDSTHKHKAIPIVFVHGSTQIIFDSQISSGLK